MSCRSTAFLELEKVVLSSSRAMTIDAKHGLIADTARMRHDLGTVIRPLHVTRAVASTASSLPTTDSKG
jgi:hypothetical protein